LDANAVSALIDGEAAILFKRFSTAIRNSTMSRLTIAFLGSCVVAVLSH
jgi:hypothetical protein